MPTRGFVFTFIMSFSRIGVFYGAVRSLEQYLSMSSMDHTVARQVYDYAITLLKEIPPEELETLQVRGTLRGIRALLDRHEAE